MEGSSYCFVPWRFKSFTVLRASAAGSKEGASLNMIPSKAGTSEFQSLLFPLLRWRYSAVYCLRNQVLEIETLS